MKERLTDLAGTNDYIIRNLPDSIQRTLNSENLVIGGILFIAMAVIALAVYGMFTIDLTATPNINSEVVGLGESDSKGKELSWEAGHERNDDIEKILVVNTENGETKALQVPGSSTSVSFSQDYRMYVITEGPYGSTERKFVAVIRKGELQKPIEL